MKAKVVHIVTRLDFGGAQQNTLHTVEHLDRERFEPVLVAGPGGYLDSRARELEGKLKVHFIEDLVREVSPLRDLTALFELTRVLREENPAIVHTHSSKAGILGRIAAWLAGVPLVLHTFHGFGFHDRQHPLVKALYVWLERLAARISTRLIFVSRANVDYAARHGLVRPEDAVLIRSGVPLAGLPAPIPDKKEKRAAAGIRRDPVLVLSVGNLKPQKNPEDFLRVAEAVSKKRPQISFVFVGDGPARAKLEARAIARGLSRVVSFTGWREDVRELIAASDIFLMTSLWEGLPRALVEAMKSEIPPVCYATDGIRDLVRDGLNGFSARPGDWETLAERVLELAENATLRQRLGKQAAAAIGSEFDIDEMVRAQERLLGSLLEGLAGPSLSDPGR
jgi:glycosyltransferase involved in cell wall biosynthesis